MAGNPKFTKAETMKRTAMMRAAILAFINKSEKSVQFAEIRAAVKDTMEKCEYNDNALSNFLYNLAKSKAISKHGGQGYSEYAKSGFFASSGNGQEKSAPKPKPKPTKNIPTALTVDVVESTGRIRIKLKGLIIEIGVVEE